MICITIALLTTPATLAPAQAQQASIFHDAAGRVTGSARTDSNGVTTFHDAFGRTTGTARTDSNGTTKFYDAYGRTTGSVRSMR
jgi:YD repeat-containing protein